MKKTIKIDAAGTELKFSVATSDYNDYLNGLMPDNKVAPNHNLAMRTVHPEHREALTALFDDHPGAALQIGGLLAQEFAPQIEISVKK